MIKEEAKNFSIEQCIDEDSFQNLEKKFHYLLCLFYAQNEAKIVKNQL